MAQLLDLPETVVETAILPHLCWNDLLRCRRVCKYVKTISDGFLRANPKMAPEIEISEDDEGKSLSAYMELGIPTTKLYINNPSGHEFFDNLDAASLSNFVAFHGSVIDCLRLEQLSIYPCFNEWTFLSSLSSLSMLQASFIGYGIVGTSDDLDRAQRHKIRAQTDTRFDNIYFPETFNKTLKSIKIGNMHPLGCKYAGIHNRMSIILNDCEKLLYISFPVHLQYHHGSNMPPVSKFYQPRDVLVQMMTEFLNSIVVRKQIGKNHIKYVDFENYHVNWTYQVDYVNGLVSPIFLALCKQANESHIKLRNVQPAWLSSRLSQRDEVLRSADIGNSIASLINLEPCIIPLNMASLGAIDIRQTSHSGYGIKADEGRPQWQSLKLLMINVDLRSEFKPEQAELHSLFDFFFKNIVRHLLTVLYISFESELSELAPKTEDIVASCPNLKTLKISNWPGTNEALTILWSGLPALEHVILKNCSGLRNEAFIGEDAGNPVSVKLKNLKKLTLKGLDRMPKITDALFSCVLARLKLTHLILTSQRPLVKVTKVGIGALLSGIEFSASIEKFPFCCWSLADLPDEEFKMLEKQFRSSQMS